MVLRFEWFTSLKRSEVQQLCVNRKLEVSGTKAVLIDRLREFQEQNMRYPFTVKDTRHTKWTVKQLNCELKGRGLSHGRTRLNKQQMKEFLNLHITYEENKLLSMIESPFWLSKTIGTKTDNEVIQNEMSMSTSMSMLNDNNDNNNNNNNQNAVQRQQELYRRMNDFAKLEKQLRCFVAHLKKHSKLVLEQSQYALDYSSKKSIAKSKLKNANREYLSRDEWQNVREQLRSTKIETKELMDTLREFGVDEFENGGDDSDDEADNDIQYDVQYIGNHERGRGSSSAMSLTMDGREFDSDTNTNTNTNSCFVVYDNRNLLKPNGHVLIAVMDTNKAAEQLQSKPRTVIKHRFQIQEKIINRWFEDDEEDDDMFGDDEQEEEEENADDEDSDIVGVDDEAGGQSNDDNGDEDDEDDARDDESQ